MKKKILLLLILVGLTFLSGKPETGGPVLAQTTTITLQPQARADDGYEYNGYVYTEYENITLNAANPYAGLRFQSVGIPQGATITSATLEVYLPSTSYDSPNSRVYGQAIDDASPFDDYNSSGANFNISSRTRTTNYVTWSGTDIGTGWKSSPNISSVIQEIVNRSGWSAYNDLVLILQAQSGCSLVFYSCDRGYYPELYTPPKLTITYTGSPPPPPSSGTVIYQPQARADDGYEYNGYVYTEYENITLNAANPYAGLRFQSVGIPQGATITSATLEVYLPSTSYDSPNSRVYGQAIDDASPFDDYNSSGANFNISNRTRTSIYTTWSSTDIGTGWKATPNISSVIQEIVNRSGWSAYNDLVLILQAQSGCSLVFYSCDRGYYPELYTPPKLTITYTAPTPTPTPTPTLTPTPTPTTPVPTPTPTPSPVTKTMIVDSGGRGGVVSAETIIKPDTAAARSQRLWVATPYSGIDFPSYEELKDVYNYDGATSISNLSEISSAGVYKIEDDYEVASSPCSLGVNAVVFINGDVTTISTDFGPTLSNPSVSDLLTARNNCNSSLVFIVRGDINISPTVNNIYGIFYAGGDINTGSSSNRLYIFGGLLANGFGFGRNLGTDNPNYPAEQVIYMPKYFLDLGSANLLGQTRVTWRER